MPAALLATSLCAGTQASTGRADHRHLDVPAWRLDASHRQHAVPVDFREQRGRCHGHGRFVVFYLLCGVAAVLAQALPAPDSTIPMIGASGAISGVLGAYLLLYPRARVLVLIPLGYFSRMAYLPAILVLGFWFLLQFFSILLTDPNQPGVAFGAHAGVL